MSSCSNHSASDTDSDDCRPLKAVTGIGRQEESNIFIFGPKLHFQANGEIVLEEEREYVWIPEILQKLQCPINNLVALPVLLDENPLHTVVSGMMNILGRNVISGVHMLGMYIGIDYR